MLVVIISDSKILKSEKHFGISTPFLYYFSNFIIPKYTQSDSLLVLKDSPLPPSCMNYC